MDFSQTDEGPLHFPNHLRARARTPRIQPPEADDAEARSHWMSVIAGMFAGLFRVPAPAEIVDLSGDEVDFATATLHVRRMKQQVPSRGMISSGQTDRRRR
jgi:hypothetical protein